MPSLPPKPGTAVEEESDEEEEEENDKVAPPEDPEDQEDLEAYTELPPVPVVEEEPKPVEVKETPEQLFQKQMKKRLNVVMELISTEETYMIALDIIVDNYYATLIEKAETEELPGITKEDIRCIFSNVSHLIPIHQTLTESVRQRVDNWSDEQMVGDILLKMVRLLLFLCDHSSSLTTQYHLGALLPSVQQLPEQLRESASRSHSM